MSNIVLKNINKIYPNGFQAVYDFNLEIKEGEFITLVGPSGCGKSTTLRMIAALENISDGEIYINGKLVNDKSPKERGIAMVFQSYALYPHMTVFDNLAFCLEIEAYDKDYIEEKVINVSKILGLEKYLDRLPKNLSGGQRQRVALGRAIIRKTNIFLMDEPLSNLDALQRINMRSEIIDIHRKIKATTIYVTHDQIEAMTLSDRIVVMKDGFIQQVGSPKELYFEPVNMFVASFIGEPPMNFIECEVLENELLLNNSFSRLAIDERFNFINQYTRVYLGFRPEIVKINDDNNKDCFKIRVKKEIEEMLGDSTNIYASIGDKTIIVRCDSHLKDIVDDYFEISIDYKNVYFFDYESEKRIKYE